MVKRGRRDNGLDARSFVPLRDVDPRVGEHLLDVLYAAGIAAYLDPTSDVDSYTRAISLPSPPSDRLFVDRANRTEATSLVAEHADDPPRPAAGETPSASGDDAWSQIVADYHRQPDGPVAPWPAAEDTDDGDQDPGADSGADVRHRRRESRRAHPSQHGRERSADSGSTLDGGDVDEDTDGEIDGDTEDAELEEHYVPPPPPPVPRPTQATMGALVMIAVGAMLLVAPGVLDLGADISFILGVFSIVGGVGLLVYRMHEKAPYDEDPDDGAVV